ncbi:ABC transporter ATP-binding protein [Falsiroseomonas stagni]|jgi:oligopeptide/dipeptide ABC transporter ATP-binding protein|uniref:Oligopeptide transport system ATP-binding protein n=1 Tax=Falsiroseomonas stagni DSM 19981 TaxID=1123062 RepID=A0A1I4DUQ9_9PROT|nr:ABC transporter ATP-binding protein [Falsiroseomonas stagni]SFK96783.1 oligopeptide transport system ATP-binding protein [Falsiroseomonas stagni DSM 19981]
MILDVQNLVHRFPGGVNAVNGVSFSIAAGETLGLVGESGSGKSTIGLLVTRLLAPTGGTIMFEGEDITRLSPAALRPLRARLQIVFQDPWGSLNPRMTIGRLLEEPLALHTTLDGAARIAEARRLADRVRLPVASLQRYPHELSGGQLQRVSIARAIANRPKLVVLDEPTSSLDLSVRAGILQLLDELQRETGIAMLFISHDLETVRLVSHRVIVLYLGRIAEQGPAGRLFDTPAHPYTQTLLSAHLPPDPAVKLRRHEVVGEIPSPINLPPGCFFAGRCPLVLPACTSAPPSPVILDGGHSASCLRIADGTNILDPVEERA